MNKVSIRCFSVLNIKWTDLSRHQVFENEAISVIRIRISSHLHAIEDLQKLLQSDELVRASRYHQKKDHDRFIISRAFLRIIAGKFISLPPEEILFVKGGNKKPFIANSEACPVFYNVAHAGDWILISIGNTESGVDLEYINEEFNYEEILDHSFSEQEIAYIRSSENPRNSFYVLWTRKESLLKATAKGITDDLINTPSLDTLNIVSTEIIGSDKSWDIFSFEISADHTGSLACQAEIRMDFFSIEASFGA